MTVKAAMDLADIRQRLSSEASEELAGRALADLHAQFASLAVLRKMGRVDQRRSRGVRRMYATPYIIYYRTTRRSVAIERVVHDVATRMRRGVNPGAIGRIVGRCTKVHPNHLPTRRVRSKIRSQRPVLPVMG